MKRCSFDFSCNTNVFTDRNGHCCSAYYITPFPFWVMIIHYNCWVRLLQARFYGGAKHPQTKSIAPSVNAVMAFHCRFGNYPVHYGLRSGDWFLFLCFCSVEECSQTWNFFSKLRCIHHLKAEINNISIDVCFVIIGQYLKIWGCEKI